MTSIARGAGKWTIAEVKDLAAFMAERGITLIELAGLKLVRHPQQALYGSLAEKAQELQNATAGRTPTDEELLENPLAGLDEALGNG